MWSPFARKGAKERVFVELEADGGVGGWKMGGLAEVITENLQEFDFCWRR